MKLKTAAGAVIIALTAAMAVTACGGAKPQTQTGSGAVTGSSAVEAPAEVHANAYDTGSFTVMIPEGWNAVPQDDIFGDKDAQGNFPKDPDSLVVAKGTDDEFRAVTGANVRIIRYHAGTTVMDSRSFYENVEELGEMNLNGAVFTGFRGDSLGYTYEFLQRTFENGDTFEYQILVATDDGATGIDREDPEVEAILASAQPKAEENTETAE